MKSIKYNSAKNLCQNQRSNSSQNKFVIKGKKDTYNITETIGKGTFGKVKLAYSIKNPKIKYACKILEKSNITEEDDLRRCLREMSILLQMDHPNVIKTYEIISDSMRYYIIMEYCSKGELFDLIVKESHFSEEKSALFFYQIISGVEYIHSKKICHRDLKPENLLLNSDEELKIIDFGLSNYKTKENNYVLKTPCGSPCYASPEMILGKKYDGFGIDIWSTGIILYAMLCGYLPFEEGQGENKNELLFKNIVKCKLEYPEQFVGKSAKNLLEKIIVRDPKERISINEIKRHPFYLMGKNIYLKKYGNIRNKTNENIKGSFSLKTSINLNLNLNDNDLISNNKSSKSNKFMNINRKNIKIVNADLLSIDNKENSNVKFNTYNNSTGHYLHTNYDKFNCINQQENDLRHKELLMTSMNKYEENKIDKRFYNLKGININSKCKKSSKNQRNKININHPIRTNFSGRNKKVKNYNSNFNTLDYNSQNYNTNRIRNFPQKMKIFQKSIKELNFKSNEPLYNITTPTNKENIHNNYITNYDTNNIEVTNYNMDMNKKYTKTEGNFGQGKSNNNQKNKKNINPKIYEISSKYINTVINTNSNNIIDSSKNRSENKNKNSVRKNKINFSKTSLNNEMKNYNENKTTKKQYKSTKSLKMKYISNLDKNDCSENSIKQDNKYTIKVRPLSKYTKTISNSKRESISKGKNINSINKKIYSFLNNFCNDNEKKFNNINKKTYTINVPKYINEYQIKNMWIEKGKNDKEPLNLNKITFSNNPSMHQRKKSHNKINIKHSIFDNKIIKNISNNINFNKQKSNINYNHTLDNQGQEDKRVIKKNGNTKNNLSKKSSYNTSRTKMKNNDYNDTNINKLLNNYIDNKFKNKNLDLQTEICFNKNNFNANSENIQTNQNDINNNKIVINLNILKPKIFVDKYKSSISKRNKNSSSGNRNNLNNIQKKKKSKNQEIKKENHFSFIETFLNNVINNKLNSNEKRY